MRILISVRLRENLKAVGITFFINFTITLTLVLAVDDITVMVIVGIIAAPIFGGIYRSLYVHKDDVYKVIIIMFILDACVFVPVVNLFMDAIPEYWFGMVLGAWAGGIMAVSGTITYFIRRKREKKVIPLDKTEI